MSIALSILDLATIGDGATAATALRDTLAHATRADELGLTRFWVAEHHGQASIASSAPAVLVAAVASATRQIRVGAGGVLLPNHAPLAVAEQFGTLEALYPNRIDLGLGRTAPQPTLARALRATTDDGTSQIAELRGFLGAGFPAGHPYAELKTVPSDGVGPPLWILGSTEGGASLAGQLGLPFAFAHHLRPDRTQAALDTYRATFRPSGLLERPVVLLAVQVLCADDDETAAYLSAPAALSMILAAGGGASRPVPTVAEAALYPWTRLQRAIVEGRRATQAVGGPDPVRRRLTEIVARTGADEVIMVTLVHQLADRLGSLERVRGLFGDGPLPRGWAPPVRSPGTGSGSAADR